MCGWLWQLQMSLSKRQAEDCCKVGSPPLSNEGIEHGKNWKVTKSLTRCWE